MSVVRARAQILAAALLFSTGGAAIKAVSFTPFQVAGLRSLIAAGALYLLLPATRVAPTLRMIGVALAYAATLILFVLATRMTTAANAIFLQSTAPLYVLLLGPRLLRERGDRGALLLLGALVVGVGLFFLGTEPPRQSAPDPLRGNLLAALSGVTWALTVLGLRLLGRVGGGGASAAAAALGNVAAFLLCLPFAWPLPIPGDARSWAGIAYLGVFQVSLAYVFLTAGLRRLPALEVSLLLLIEPALNPLWAWLWQGERPGTLALCGGALILGATTLKTILSSGEAS